MFYLAKKSNQWYNIYKYLFKDMILMKQLLKKFKKLNYVLCLPDDYEEGKKYPVVLLLHGAGGRGDDAAITADNPYCQEIAKHKSFEFVSVLPQCPADRTWFNVFEQLTEFAEWIYNSDFTDRRHFYGMGASMGGYGIWELAMQSPELFAAIVPVCGGGMYWNAGRLKSVPVWAFHGGRDGCVLPEESKKMVDAVNREGGCARLTIYPENDHNAWSDTYKNREVFDWLLSCTKEETTVAENKYTSSEIYG